jgi:hypothetical protein
MAMNSAMNVPAFPLSIPSRSVMYRARMARIP